MAMAEPQDFVHVFDTKEDFARCQEVDLFGEISGISFSPDGEALFVGIADRTYGSLLEYHRNRNNKYRSALLWQDDVSKKNNVLRRSNFSWRIKIILGRLLMPKLYLWMCVFVQWGLPIAMIWGLGRERICAFKWPFKWCVKSKEGARGSPLRLYGGLVGWVQNREHRWIVELMLSLSCQ